MFSDNYVHLANAIGPKKIIDEEFKKGHVACEIHDGKGGMTWIECVIDYSLKQPEIEIKGKSIPSSHVRDVVVDATKYTDSVLKMRQDLKKDNRQINSSLGYITTQAYDNGQSLCLIQETQVKDSINSEIFQQDIRSRLDIIKRQYPHLQEKLLEIQDYYEDFKTEIFYSHDVNSRQNAELKVYFIELIENVVKSIDINREGNEVTRKSVENSFLDIAMEINNAKEHLSQKIDSVKLDLENILKQELRGFRKDVQNNLTLVLMNISRLQGLSTTQIINHLEPVLNRSKRTIYNYFNKLHASGYLNKNTIKKNGPGRPSFNFTISHKFKNLKEKSTKNTRLEIDNE